VVDLAVQRSRREVAEVVVRRAGHLLDLFVEATLVFLSKVLDRRLDPLALLEELHAEMVGVDAHARLSFLPRSVAEADDTRRSIVPGPSPSSSTILSRPLWPETIVSDSRGTESASASRRSTASFARPCSGAAVTRTFHPSAYRPTISARPEPGLTRRRTRVD